MSAVSVAVPQEATACRKDRPSPPGTPAVADGVIDGDQPYTIITDPAVSDGNIDKAVGGDPNYHGLNPPNIDGINYDIDAPPK